jgi:hypothetical protein
MTTTAPDIHVLSAESSRAEVVEALGHVCREATRAPHVIHRYGQPLTKHERLHAFLDELLTMLERASA